MIEQIELIRKDLNSLYKYRQDDFNYIGCHNDIIRHLNVIEELFKEIQNTDDKYKKAWEELYSEKEKPCSIEFMQDLEQKHGIGVE